MRMFIRCFGINLPAKGPEAMPQRWFIRNTSIDLLTGRRPPGKGHERLIGHVTEMTGHDPEFGGHDAETVGHDGPKYAIGLDEAVAIAIAAGERPARSGQGRPRSIGYFEPFSAKGHPHGRRIGRQRRAGWARAARFAVVQRVRKH